MDYTIGTRAGEEYSTGYKRALSKILYTAYIHVGCRKVMEAYRQVSRAEGGWIG